MYYVRDMPFKRCVGFNCKVDSTKWPSRFVYTSTYELAARGKSCEIFERPCANKHISRAYEKKKKHKYIGREKAQR